MHGAPEYRLYKKLHTVVDGFEMCDSGPLKSVLRCIANQRQLDTSLGLIVKHLLSSRSYTSNLFYACAIAFVHRNCNIMLSDWINKLPARVMSTVYEMSRGRQPWLPSASTSIWNLPHGFLHFTQQSQRAKRSFKSQHGNCFGTFQTAVTLICMRPANGKSPVAQFVTTPAQRVMNLLRYASRRIRCRPHQASNVEIVLTDTSHTCMLSASRRQKAVTLHNGF